MIKTRSKTWLLCIGVLCILIFISTICISKRKNETVLETAIPFTKGSTATYPYDFTGKSTDWTITETAKKISKTTGAEYILILDKANEESLKSVGIKPEKLEQYVKENECETIEVDSYTRYILMPEQVKQLRSLENLP